ncbi:MAG: response regulator [Cellvibrionales bacterium]|nr:response regulator [Cellvibrionales bacterium]
MGIESALIVDDSKLARITLRKKLQRHGVEADMAGSAKEALDIIQKSKPQIVFMDHLMPEMDGFEATKVIRAMPDMQDLPIIMCTGKDHDGYLQEAQAVGANSTLTKPPTEDTLASILSMNFSDTLNAKASEALELSSAETFDELASLAADNDAVERIDEAVSELNDIALTLEGTETDGSLDDLLDGLLTEEDTLSEDIVATPSEDFDLDLELADTSFDDLLPVNERVNDGNETLLAQDALSDEPVVMPEVIEEPQAIAENAGLADEVPVASSQPKSHADLSEIKANVEQMVNDSVAIAVAEKVAQTVASQTPQIKASVLEEVHRELEGAIDGKVQPVKVQFDEVITRLTSEILSLSNQTSSDSDGLSENAVNTLILQKLQLLWKKTNKLVDSRMANLPVQQSSKDYAPVIAAIESQIAQLQEAQFKPEHLSDDEDNLLVEAQADQIRQLQVELLETKNSIRSAKVVGLLGVVSGLAAAGVVAARFFGYL